MIIRVKYHHPDLKRIQRIHVGDWIDLRCAENVSLKKDEVKLISLGVSMELPHGYEAHLVVRSSTPKKWKVVQLNPPGIIDQSYCGDNDVWKLFVRALDDTNIPFNTRIAQFRIFKKQPEIDFVEVEHLGNTDRGGFGEGTKDFD